MTEPLDRSRRDSTLFQFTTKQLRDFIDPNHLLIRIDGQLDFAKLVEPLEGFYCPDFGRPAIHPEVMVKAAADLLAVQHRILPQAVLGNLEEHRPPLVLFPDHRRSGV